MIAAKKNRCFGENSGSVEEDGVAWTENLRLCGIHRTAKEGIQSRTFDVLIDAVARHYCYFQLFLNANSGNADFLCPMIGGLLINASPQLEIN